jgi:hypothetical protein
VVDEVAGVIVDEVLDELEDEFPGIGIGVDVKSGSAGLAR